MLVLSVFITASLVVPHVCLDYDSNSIILEQQAEVNKTAAKNHHNSKTADHCCITSHCCLAKILNPALSVGKTAFYTKAGMISMALDHFSSLDPKALDRPPKFFA